MQTKIHPETTPSRDTSRIPKPAGAFARGLIRLIDAFYFPFIRRFVPLQTFRYAVCGGGNMLLDWLLYYLIYHYVVGADYLDLGFFVISPHVEALIIVWPITFFNGFWLNRNIAFRSSPLRERTQLMRYLLSVMGSFVLSYLCTKLFVEVLYVFPTPAHILATGVTVVYSYLMQKYFTFRGCATD